MQRNGHSKKVSLGQSSVARCLPDKREVLSSIPTTQKKIVLKKR